MRITPPSALFTWGDFTSRSLDEQLVRWLPMLQPKMAATPLPDSPARRKRGAVGDADGVGAMSQVTGAQGDVAAFAKKQKMAAVVEYRVVEGKA
eukprot:6072273-Karenia_brevis.AAC.1